MQESELCAGRAQDYRNVIFQSAFCWAMPFKLIPIRFARKSRHDTPPSCSPAHRHSTGLRFSTGSIPAMVEVFKSPSCGCCGKWVEHLRQNGFQVQTHDVNDIPATRKKLGMPDQLGSCHTASDRRLRRRRACPRSGHQAPAQGQTEGLGSGRTLDASRLARYGKCHASVLPNAFGASRRYEQSIRPTLVCPEKR
jgi:hypothetical protein